MNKTGAIISGIFLWSYERGTWQYDVMCILIVAFILLTPRGFFQGNFKPVQPSLPAVQEGPQNRDSRNETEVERHEKIVQIGDKK